MIPVTVTDSLCIISVLCFKSANWICGQIRHCSSSPSFPNYRDSEISHMGSKRILKNIKRQLLTNCLFIRTAEQNWGLLCVLQVSLEEVCKQILLKAGQLWFLSHPGINWCILQPDPGPCIHKAQSCGLLCALTQSALVSSKSQCSLIRCLCSKVAEIDDH